MADVVVEWSRHYRDKYIPLMVEMCMYNDDATHLACYLAWGSSTESRLLIDAILDELHQSRQDEPPIIGLMRLITQVMNMGDNLQAQRLHLFLHGENVPHRAGGVVQNEAPLPGFLDLTIAPNMLMYKRFVMLRWLVNAHDAERPSFMQPPPEVCLQAMAVRAPRSCSASRALRADAWRSRSTWRT